MANSIRTPKQGVTAGSRRIAEAVDDEDWQKFRLSMKGKSTQDKLWMLKQYWNDNTENGATYASDDVYIRIDNYLKALARGGQIEKVEDGDYISALWLTGIVIKK
jgi:hypothetical protein